jgi:hypothetical protein
MYLIEINFLGKMKSVIYVEGGIVCMESIKIIRQQWIEPLIDVKAIISSVVINFFFNIITNCNYTCEALPYKSGIIFVSDSNLEDIMLNISYCSFDENTLNLYYNDSGFGGACYFGGGSFESGILNEKKT